MSWDISKNGRVGAWALAPLVSEDHATEHDVAITVATASLYPHHSLLEVRYHNDFVRVHSKRLPDHVLQHTSRCVWERRRHGLVLIEWVDRATALQGHWNRFGAANSGTTGRGVAKAAVRV